MASRKLRVRKKFLRLKDRTDVEVVRVSERVIRIRPKRRVKTTA